MASVSTLMAFGVMPFMGKEDPEYGCVEYEINYSRESECFQLRLNDERFWSDKEGKDGWAYSIQIGAVCGILACVMGAVAWGLLLSATCLEIKERRLMNIRVMLVGSAAFALLTMTAAAADACGVAMNFVVDSPACENKRFRLGHGAVAMLAGSVLYLVATVSTIGFLESSAAQVPTRDTVPLVDKQESAQMEGEGNV
jgi:hypothetical protein